MLAVWRKATKLTSAAESAEKLLKAMPACNRIINKTAEESWLSAASMKYGSWPAQLSGAIFWPHIRIELSRKWLAAATLAAAWRRAGQLRRLAKSMAAAKCECQASDSIGNDNLTYIGGKAITEYQVSTPPGLSGVKMACLKKSEEEASRLVTWLS